LKQTQGGFPLDASTALTPVISVWRKANEREREIRRRRALVRIAASISLVLSSLVVLNHMLGWYGNSRGKGPPLPFDRAVVEFVFLFVLSFLVLLAMASFKARSGRPVTNVVICPSCKKVAGRGDSRICDCGVEYEDLADWVWERDHNDDADRTIACAQPHLTISERMQIWMVRFFEG
jgi:hypothetical protein